MLFHLLLLDGVADQNRAWWKTGFAAGVFRDDFFLYRTSGWDVDTSGFQSIERSMIIDHRWWPVPELADTTEIVYPLRLVQLLEQLLAGRVPVEPVALPWHH